VKDFIDNALNAVKNVDSSQLLDQAKELLTQNSKEPLTPRDISSIQLVTIREGKSPAILVVNGFLSQDDGDVSDWLSVVDELYPKNKVIHVQWNAGNLSQMVLDDGIVTGGVSGDKGAGKVLAAVKLARGLTPVGIASIVGGVAFDKIVGHWKKSFHETLHVGHDLAKIIEEDKSLNCCILMGHSLGARVIRHTLTNLEQNKVAVCYLLAGAVSIEDEQWITILEKHSDLCLINCYSDNDYTLKTGYRVGTLFAHTPAGLAEMSGDKKQVVNVDMSEFVSGHMNYKHKTFGFELWNSLNKLTLIPKTKLKLSCIRRPEKVVLAKEDNGSFWDSLPFINNK